MESFKLALDSPNKESFGTLQTTIITVAKSLTHFKL